MSRQRVTASILPPAAGAALYGAAGLAWLAGIAAQLQQPVLWPADAYAAMAAAALLLLGLAAWPRPRRVVRLPCLLLALALLGFAGTGVRALQRLAERLPAALEGQPLQLVGVIEHMPQPGAQGTRFVLRTDGTSLQGQPARVPERVALGWYGGFDGDALLAAAPPPLRAGQRWSLSVRLRRPHGTLNPHGFDLELWLFEQRIGATGTVRGGSGSANRLLDEHAGASLERARQRLRDAILLRVPDPAAAGVLAALAVGDQAAIASDEWDLFRDTGVAHLMSISGLHVTLFAWLAAALIGALWRGSARLMLAVPAPLAARWGGVLAAAGYALLAGWGVPAQRTLWMLATVALLRSIGRQWPALLVLLAAAVVVALFDPWALLQPGFWLSFAAVALLLAAEPAAGTGHRTTWRGRLRAGLRTQAVASVGLAPLSLVFFQQVSLVGFAANLVAIPLVTLAVVPLTLAGIAAPPLWLLASALVQAMLHGLHWLAALPLGLWTAAAAPAWAAAAGLLGGALLLLPLPWRLRLLGLPLLLPLLAPPVVRPAPGQFELVAADIGQGSAVLLRTRTHLLVYDAGPRHPGDSDAAQRVLLPLLRARGDERIDLLLLSHGDSDHAGGAASLLARLPVAALASSLRAGDPLLAAGVPHRRCAAGQQWQWDGVHFELLHPPGADDHPATPANALSCVLRVQARDGRSVLLTGDIGQAQEAALIERYGQALRAQVLLVPHHGSRGSSSAAFIAAVAPGTALVQAGYRNRFGHPAAETLARYRALGVELLRSDRCGAWTWQASGASHCERDAAARYWHDRGGDAALPVPSATAAAARAP
ncbi:MAG TPA: DNA internalization-related competence protein ComEC/Rec2 [Rubrivivax sp.]|nr:DNA internalization-related competence protein ComEC/Rec2 [Rubrivivax sp.]